MKRLLSLLALMATFIASSAHSVRVAYCVQPNGMIRIYLEHWHGDYSAAQMAAEGNTITVTTQYGAITTSQTLLPTGVVNNVAMSDLSAHCGGSINLVNSCANAPLIPPGTCNAAVCNDWGYWDFAPAACNVPVTITINLGNTVVFTEGCADLFPATITTTFNDVAGPIMTCPQSVTVDNDPGQCGAVVTYTEPTATDACQFCPMGAAIANYTYLGNHDGHDYYRSNTPGSWTAQNNAAQALGGHLATVGSAGENAFLTTATGGATSWIGFTDQAVEGTYVWSNGEPVTYTNWDQVCDNEPNNSGDEDYAVINWCVAGHWNDLPNTSSYNGIVEFECVKPVRTSGPGTASGSVFPIGTTTVTYTATDNSNNTSTCSFTVTVNDVQNPTITCPQNTIVDCQASTDPSATGAATVADNCPGASVTGYTDITSQGNCAGNKTIFRTWSAKDASNNTVTCTQTITVQDNTGPTITCPATATIACHATDRSPSATGSGMATAQDNCSGVASINYSDGPDVAGNCPGNKSFTRTWTATDNCGNFSTCTQTINVVDNVGPNAVCNNATVTLQNGSASVSPSQIGNGSTDNCSGIASYSLSKSMFTCNDIGANTVTLTVTDNCGNSSTCTSTVNVVGVKPTCTITSTPTSGTYSDGNPNHIYLGYGNGKTKLTATGSGGSSLSYSWSPAAGLSCTNCANPTFTPTAGGTYSFTATVTNEYGCTSTCTITICVIDIRVPGQSNKVYICHVPPGNPANAQTLSVGVNAVAAHLGNHNGDRLGPCNQSCGSSLIRMAGGNSDAVGDEVKIYPNPTNGTFTVELPYVDEDMTSINVTDVAGKTIQKRIVREGDGYKLDFELGNVAKGVYFVEVSYGDQRFRSKLIIQ